MSSAEGLSKYRKDTQTSQRHTKTRKDGQKHAKTGKDVQRHPKMAKRRLKLTKTHKDGQRHSNKAKRCLKLSKIDKDTQRRQKIFIVDKDTRKIEEKKQKCTRIIQRTCYKTLVYKTHFVIDLYTAYKKLCFRIMNIDLYLVCNLFIYTHSSQLFAHSIFDHLKLSMESLNA